MAWGTRILAHINTAIVVLNWNGFADTRRCLESLLRLDSDHFRVFVCDNASTDDSVRRLEAWIAQRLPPANAERTARNRRPISVSLIETGGNYGYAGGNNAGLRRALAEGFDTFWLLNNDCEVEPEALRHLLERIEEDPSIGLCGSTLVYAHDPSRVQTRGGGSFARLKGRGVAIDAMGAADVAVDRDGIEARMRFVNGASTLVTRTFLDAVGLLCEDYFLYWEELDWAARSAGRFRLGYAPLSVVRHRVGASIGTSDFGPGSALSAYYLARNRLRFCWRYSRISLPFVYFDMARAILGRCRDHNWAWARVLSRATLGLPFEQPA